ncbi:hypothetical protein EV652_101466 [Kribbella steppae]|uniref:Uncharacterized protein n=1 Tax=Kribbella steppae TaxID=2512223 RepID=A0A4R2HVZ7_9ACTN|nr:hypothetical protein [Kribbella steppae]TCO35582.1 hypothetical protein EV652_101466 [Kribbella steppae]
MLIEAELDGFVPQVRIGDDRFHARVDLADTGRRLVIEADSMAAASPSAGGPAAHEGFVPARSSLAFLTRAVGRGARTVRFVDGTNRDGSLVVRQLGWVPVTVTSARLITPALVAGDCTLT